jgi:hypothetical protein
MEGNQRRGKRVKRKQLHGDDGWTLVAGSSSGSGSKVSPAVSQARDARPTRIVDGLTAEKLANEFKDMTKQWQKSSCARNLDKMLRLRDWTVNQAICIGIGSFSLDWEHRWRSMWQLVLFMAVVKVCKYTTILWPSYVVLTNAVQDHSPTIILHAQEPIFTPLDSIFLSTLSVTVLHTGIDSHITPTSFVFAPFVDWYVLLPVFLKDRDPELYVGNEILVDYKVYANIQEKKTMLEDGNAIGSKFVVGRERRQVPEFEGHGSALEGLMVYWREDVDEGDE